MKIKYIILLGIIFFASSCKKHSLQTEYKNSTDYKVALQNPGDVYGIASGMFFNWHKAQYHAYTFSPIMALWTMADQGTGSWGNGAMLDLSSEPRASFVNVENYSHSRITMTYYERLYGNIGTANDILKVINNGLEIGNINEAGEGEDNSYFNQGISFGYLALVFDKAYIVTEETDWEVDEVNPVSYKEMANAAIISLERCIQVCENNSFSVPDDWINGSEYSNTELAQLAHSFIARILIGLPRNIAENNETDWDKILTHATAGIQRDLAPFMDNTTWYQWFFHYTFKHDKWDWCGIDSRIINMMDENYPKVYPDLRTEPKPARAISADHRLITDFKYDSSCPLKSNRGYYHFFDYEYKRYFYTTYSNPSEVIDFMTTENDLIIAEAKFRTGDKSGAIDIINSGSRVLRGNLTELEYNISDEDFLYALFYERDIELLMTGFGTAFFDMRRRNMLQTGTPLHFPIPAKELNANNIPLYTFGGVENADGINTSNGGWK